MLLFLANWTSDSFLVNNEPWLVRTASHATGSRIQSFCDAVRLRDRRCVISGEKAVCAHLNVWTGFEAAHIFPLAYEGEWEEQGYGRWITSIPISGGTINSVQNGMLLNSSIHQLFDSYHLAVNPDVCMHHILIEDIITGYYFRIIIRSCSLRMMEKVLLESIWTKTSLMTLNDLSIRFCDGILDRLS